VSSFLTLCRLAGRNTVWHQLRLTSSRSYGGHRGIRRKDSVDPSRVFLGACDGLSPAIAARLRRSHCDRRCLRHMEGDRLVLDADTERGKVRIIRVRAGHVPHHNPPLT